MAASGIPQSSDSAVIKAVTKDETAKHCRRRTRGQSTTGNIEDLLLSLTSVTDTLEVPVLRKDLSLIWEEEKKHIPCLQDSPNIQLYTKTGNINKSGVELPVFQCAQGSTSLESFHLHLNRFTPGTAANALHFQAYLLNGVTRWNEHRSTASITSGGDGVRSFDTRLRQRWRSLVCLLWGTQAATTQATLHWPGDCCSKLGLNIKYHMIFGLNYIQRTSSHFWASSSKKQQENDPCYVRCHLYGSQRCWFWLRYGPGYPTYQTSRYTYTFIYYRGTLVDLYMNTTKHNFKWCTL